MSSFLLFCSVLTALLCQVFAVTLTTSSTAYTVDAESANSFQFTVTRSSCDITSILYRGSQVQYQGGSFSQISSGLGTATVSAKSITADGVDYVMITCETSTLTHYYVVRDTDSTLHMATFTTAEPTVGELRWIGRLVPDLVPDDDVSQASDTADGTAIEGSDVFLVGDETRSKFYSSERFIDDQVHCLSGSTMKACMLLPGTAYESSSGGPFHRDINTNPSGTMNNLYFYMNSGHVTLEPFRTGLFGPYALVFSRSGTPSTNADLSFWENFGISGYVAEANRGFVIGKANGIDGSIYPIVVHWFNDAAQYWVYADSSTNDFSSPAMKPGTYDMALYQDELEVANATGIVVTSGSSVTHNIDSTWTTPATTLFQIGDWDGQPTGFRNADLQLRMHPSDARMASWGPLTYTVGSSALTDFPMAIFQGVNDPVTISFTLTSAQASGAATLRIGTTLSFAGGRPIPVVNSKTFSAPAAPVTIDSRGVTRGAYRGWGDRYDFAVPAGSLVAGTNKITISVASGSSGADFLAPNFIFDSVHLFR